jgi:hypothetical protein
VDEPKVKEGGKQEGITGFFLTSTEVVNLTFM